MSNAAFERLAAKFYRETGMMAPGKDQPAAMGGPSIEEREDRWRLWCAEQTTPVIDLMMALKDALRQNAP